MENENNVPNLDAMDAADLWKLWERSLRPRRSGLAAELFPHKPRGYIRVTQDLGCYASFLAMFRDYRRMGDGATALACEGICGGIHSRLPSWAKW